jgi:uncharacterized cupin superfamily protein
LETLNAISAELAATGPEKRIIVGECQTSKLPFLETPELRFGVWECTAGSWVSSWDAWEYFTVVAGKGILVDGAGTTHVLQPGVSVMIPAGSTGVWTLDEPLRKTYVVPVVRAA